MDPSRIFTGSLLATECDATVNYNAGCGILDTDGRSYGAGLNDQGGGVFATLWDGEGIRICAFISLLEVAILSLHTHAQHIGYRH